MVREVDEIMQFLVVARGIDLDDVWCGGGCHVGTLAICQSC